MQNTFTVIDTVFNKAKTLKRCLDSILSSSFNEFEIIIINDGSTDDSQSIIEQYQKKYKNINVYKQTNMGIGYTRKLGIQSANGEYIIFVDADDTIDLNLLSVLNEEINKYPPDIIKYNINEINSSKNKNRFITKNAIFENGKKALLEWSDINIRYGLFTMYCIKNFLLKKSLIFKSNFLWKLVGFHTNLYLLAFASILVPSINSLVIFKFNSLMIVAVILVKISYW